jgi:hypothetical protein
VLAPHLRSRSHVVTLASPLARFAPSRLPPVAGQGKETNPRAHAAANSSTVLRDFNGFLKASIIKKQPGVVAR